MHDHDTTQPSQRRRIVIGLIAGMVIGLVAGVVVRPYLGSLYRSLHTGPPKVSPMSDSAYRSRTEQFQQLDMAVGDGGIVYLGDSITEWMNLEDYLIADGHTVLNRGISGDTTTGVLDRIRKSFPPRPTVCILMIGINDLLQRVPAEDVVHRIEQICGLLATDLNVHHIVLESVLPGPAEQIPAICAVNEAITTIASHNETISYLDLYPHFLVGDQTDPELYTDGVHLSGRGYSVRLQQEVQHLHQVLPDLKISLRVGREG